ncbi:hypothetical protein [Paenibacillus larvae]|uniref:hypothetical protein n=1 Tax=Paenibacillus larvae TaxID=1464 RepID=UPI001F453927|nr:hypothetical protein [Paenibacillus larvae]
MYDFKSARQRIEELKFMYRRNKKHHEKDGTWDWVIVAKSNNLKKNSKKPTKIERLSWPTTVRI